MFTCLYIERNLSLVTKPEYRDLHSLKTSRNTLFLCIDILSSDDIRPMIEIPYQNTAFYYSMWFTLEGIDSSFIFGWREHPRIQ